MWWPWKCLGSCKISRRRVVTIWKSARKIRARRKVKLALEKRRTHSWWATRCGCWTSFLILWCYSLGGECETSGWQEVMGGGPSSCSPPRRAWSTSPGGGHSAHHPNAAVSGHSQTLVALHRDLPDSKHIPKTWAGLAEAGGRTEPWFLSRRCVINQQRWGHHGWTGRMRPSVCSPRLKAHRLFITWDQVCEKRCSSSSPEQLFKFTWITG